MKKHIIICCVILILLASPFICVSKQIEIKEEKSILNGPPMDSPWPMYCHDVRHTCQSQYNSSSNPGIEKWRYKISGGHAGRTSPIIDNNRSIYFGTYSGKVCSLLSNGTLNWVKDIFGYIGATFAIDESGIIYMPTTNSYPSYIYAFDLNGSELWKYQCEEENPDSSPVIGEDGTIYFGDLSGWFYALNPNGSLKWKYKTDENIYSSPAIGEDGIIYCISANHSDGYLYTFYPNGTLKWKKDGVNRFTDVSIDDDGTIYYLSFHNLYAVNSDGSLKWKTPVNYGTTPAISDDGIIYIGYETETGAGENKTLKAFNSENGAFLWLFNPGNKKYKYISTPAISADGIIYFTTTIGDLWEFDGGEIIALNPDGTERWRVWLTDKWVKSIPTIDSDGTVFVISTHSDFCYLHSFGELDTNAPSAPAITGQTSGKPGEEYEYTFKSTSPLGRDVYYYIEWGDGSKQDWFGPYGSGEGAKASRTWSNQGTYTIRARAKDTDNLWGDWGELTVKMPRNKATTYSILLRFLERFPLLERLLNVCFA